MRSAAFPLSWSEPSIPMVILAAAVGLLAARTVIRRVSLLPPAVRRMVLETVDAALFAVVLAFFIITFVVQAFYIPSGSMEPTLRVGDRILVAKFYYRLSPIQRGDVIVFRYPLNPGKDFVKRVVGLPGDVVELRAGVVFINGQARPELTPFQQDASCPQNYGPKKVDPGHLFVMGDNRCNSEDSRFFGLVPVRNVVGKAVVIYWPPYRVGLVH